MIPGLKLDESDERRVWTAFEGWAEHFKERLCSEGVPGLIKRYDAVVSSVESRCCRHGPGGSLRTGEAWQSCCGMSYEYSNEIAVRTALAVLTDLVPGTFTPESLDQLSALDERLYALYPEGHRRQQRWWQQGLPAGVKR